MLNVELILIMEYWQSATAKKATKSITSLRTLGVPNGVITVMSRSELQREKEYAASRNKPPNPRLKPQRNKNSDCLKLRLL